MCNSIFYSTFIESTPTKKGIMALATKMISSPFQLILSNFICILWLGIRESILNWTLIMHAINLSHSCIRWRMELLGAEALSNINLVWYNFSDTKIIFFWCAHYLHFDDFASRIMFVINVTRVCMTNKLLIQWKSLKRNSLNSIRRFAMKNLIFQDFFRRLSTLAPIHRRHHVDFFSQSLLLFI